MDNNNSPYINGCYFIGDQVCTSLINNVLNHRVQVEICVHDLCNRTYWFSLTQEQMKKCYKLTILLLTCLAWCFPIEKMIKSCSKFNIDFENNDVTHAQIMLKFL
jgi:hypothetical protein